jgi:hypothetical protein
MCSEDNNADTIIERLTDKMNKMIIDTQRHVKQD